tara:strand:- start:104 stop:409 length:306 start_codon:yes stop_codon:yes gene_type:complete
MNKQTKLFYDLDKGYMIKNPIISKNLLNANYDDIIKTQKNNNKIDMYLHSIYKTDTYYEKLYNNKNISKQLPEPEYKTDTSLINLPYSEKIKKWKENIGYF